MIRRASKKEFLKFLRHESVIDRLDQYPDKIRAKNIKMYAVEYKGCRLYFWYKELGEAVEMHVGAIKEHRIYAKAMIKKALTFVKGNGYKKVFTYAPEIYNSTINMALNLGFSIYKKEYHSGYDCMAIYLERRL